MAGVRKLPSGIWQGWYKNCDGRRRWFTFTTSRRETLSMARDLEAQHKQMALGIRPRPDVRAAHLARPIAALMDAYLAWGSLQGGATGRAWSATHQQHRRQQLTWWYRTLTLETLADCVAMLPLVEQALVQLSDRSGKTQRHYLDALSAFCAWCVRLGYLAQDPLQHLSPVDTTPVRTRRVLTLPEMRVLLRAAPAPRSLLYETALLTGLRANELRQLSLEHLDLDRGGLQLDAAWTKNRQPGFQPLPGALIGRLYAFARAGTPLTLYNLGASRRRRTLPDLPLLYVPRHTERVLDVDLRTAGIAKVTTKGKIDFHALRVTYINLVITGGATVPEAQTLARHASPAMTFGVYGRADDARLQTVVDTVALTLWGDPSCAPGVHAHAIGEAITASQLDDGASRSAVPSHTSPRTGPALRSASRLHLVDASSPPLPERSTDSAQLRRPFVGQATASCAPGVHDDLQRLVAAWPTLPDVVRAQIVALLPQKDDIHG